MRWLFLLNLLLLVACKPATTEGQPIQPFDDEIQQAVAYLDAEYRRGAFGLLPESPTARPHKHWLATDNQLAVYALRAANQDIFAAQLEQAIQRWNAPPHGIIEALAGEQITWPPYPEEQYVVGPDPSQRTSTQPNVCSNPKDAPGQVICHEIRNEQMARFGDWEEYADLALYGALTACHQGDVTLARTRYRQAMAWFVDVGFADRAYKASNPSFYTTYKLALALYVAVLLGEPLEEKVLLALLDKQDKAGGFTALYDSQGGGKGDSNTETTSYALLALATLQEGHSRQLRDSVCPGKSSLRVKHARTTDTWLETPLARPNASD